MNYIPGVSGGVPKRGTPLRVDSLENKFVEFIHSSFSSKEESPTKIFKDRKK